MRIVQWSCMIEKHFKKQARNKLFENELAICDHYLQYFVLCALYMYHSFCFAIVKSFNQTKNIIIQFSFIDKWQDPHYDE